MELNRRGDGRPQVRLAVPWYGGGMSFGSVSINTILSRIKAAIRFNTMVSTGEGGFPEELFPYSDNIVTQVATGLFGVRETPFNGCAWWSSNTPRGLNPGWAATCWGTR